MAVTTSQVTVGDTATELVASTTADVIVSEPVGGVNLWIGPTGVTPSTGYPVRGEVKVSLATEALFGVVESGTAIVPVLVNT